MTKNFKDSVFYALGLYGALGVQLAVSVVAGLAFGNYIDGKIGTSPWIAIAGTILGTAGGFWNMIKILKWNGKRL